MQTIVVIATVILILATAAKRLAQAAEILESPGGNRGQQDWPRPAGRLTR